MTVSVSPESEHPVPRPVLRSLDLGKIMIGKVAAEDYELETKDDRDWMVAGACKSVGPNTMLPTTTDEIEIAKKICAECPVRGPCLKYALLNKATDDDGVRGGTTKRERSNIRRRFKRRHDNDWPRAIAKLPCRRFMANGKNLP